MNEPKHKSQTAHSIYRRLKGLLFRLEQEDFSQHMEDRALRSVVEWLKDPAAQRLLDIWMASNKQAQAEALTQQMSDQETRLGLNEAMHGRLEDRRR